MSITIMVTTVANFKLMAAILAEIPSRSRN